MQFEYLPHTETESSGRDLSTIRRYKLDNNNTVIVERTDPYGFWVMRFERGQMPKDLATAQFTSVIQAELALKNYLHTQDKKVVSKQD